MIVSFLGIEQAALLGFCWGGYVVANILSGDFSNYFNSGVIAHPTIQAEEWFYGRSHLEAKF